MRMTRDEFLMMVAVEVAMHAAWYPGQTNRMNLYRVVRLATRAALREIPEDRAPFVAREFALWALDPETYDLPSELEEPK